MMTLDPAEINSEDVDGCLCNKKVAVVSRVCRSKNLEIASRTRFYRQKSSILLGFVRSARLVPEAASLIPISKAADRLSHTCCQSGKRPPK